MDTQEWMFGRSFFNSTSTVFLFQCESPYMYFQLFKPLQCEGPYMYFQFVTGELFPCFPWDFGPKRVNPWDFSRAPAMQVTQPTPSDPADPAEGAWVQGIFVLPTQTGCHVWLVKSLEVTIPKQSFFFFFLRGNFPQVLSFVYFVLLDSPKNGQI